MALSLNLKCDLVLDYISKQQNPEVLRLQNIYQKLFDDNIVLSIPEIEHIRDLLLFNNYIQEISMTFMDGFKSLPAFDSKYMTLYYTITTKGLLFNSRNGFCGEEELKRLKIEKQDIKIEKNAIEIEKINKELIWIRYLSIISVIISISSIIISIIVLISNE